MAELDINDTPNDDLRGDLARAFASVTDTPDVSDAGAAPDAPDGNEQTPVEKPDQSAEERNRDDAGRFAKGAKPRETLKLKDKTGVPPTPGAPAATGSQTAPVAGAAPDAAPAKVDIPAPTEWLGEHKLLWKNVPNALKQKYVDDIRAAREEAGAHQPLMEAIGADRDMLIREGGGSIEGGVKRLLELSNFAIANPVQFVQTFMQQRGLNPAQVFGQGQQLPNGAAPQPELHPQLQTLQQRLDAFEARQSQQAHSATLSQIEAFANDPEHVFFNDVSDDMLAYLKENPKLGLQGAYDRAVWGNPTTRAQLLAQQPAPNNQADVEAARRAKAANLNGSPMPGGSSQPADNNEDLRATLERAYRDAAGGQRV